MADAPPRILIVEDHPLIAELVETRLRIEGMVPVPCAGGREAVARLAAEPFDAMVLDLMLPDVDGLEVLRHVRATPATARLPVLVLTARAAAADLEQALDAGADQFVTKPFSGQELVRRLRDCLAGGLPRPAVG